MMKNLLLALSMIIIFHTVQGQRAITVQSGINAISYTTIDSALAHAIDGDHIYIPGGVYQVNNLTIDKSVFIIGAGHYPDSTVATGATSLIGDVLLITGSSGGLLTGCSISGSIKVGNGIAGTDSVYPILQFPEMFLKTFIFHIPDRHPLMHTLFQSLKM